MAVCRGITAAGQQSKPILAEENLRITIKSSITIIQTTTEKQTNAQKMRLKLEWDDGICSPEI
jgi:hypothetical protein